MQGEKHKASGWLQVWVAVHECRAGRFEDAIRRLDTPEWRGGHRARAVLAMAHHGLGHAEEAARLLAEAEAGFAAHARGTFGAGVARPLGNPFEVVDDLILLREAHKQVADEERVPGVWERAYHAVALARFGEQEKAEAEFRAVVEGRANDPSAWLARGRAYAALGDAERARADLEAARSVTERVLAGSPTDANAVAVLAELLTEEEEGLMVLHPTAATSANGATLSIRPDGSVLASGTRPDTDRYTVTASLPAGTLTALWVEALPDDSLPSGGPGRHENGNFVLSELVVSAAGPDGASRPVRLRDASASFEQVEGLVGNPYGRYAAAAAIDGDARGKTWGWAILPEVGRPQVAVFRFADELSAAGGTATFELHQNFGGHSLGRFRLSVQTESDPIRDAYRLLGMDVDPHVRLALAYLARDDTLAVVGHLERITTDTSDEDIARSLVLALALQRQGSVNCAREIYQRVVASDPPDDEAATLARWPRRSWRNSASMKRRRWNSWPLCPSVHPPSSTRRSGPPHRRLASTAPGATGTGNGACGTGPSPTWPSPSALSRTPITP